LNVENLFSTKILAIILWLVEHKGEYTASLIQEELGLNVFTLVKYLHLLDTLDICDVNPDEFSDELFITVNEKSDIIKAFKTIEDLLYEAASKSREVAVCLDDYDIALTEIMDDLSMMLLADLYELADEIEEESADNEFLEMDDIKNAIQRIIELREAMGEKL
jgi:hypothetical protein